LWRLTIRTRVSEPVAPGGAVAGGAEREAWLWLGILEELATRVAHDFRNVFNGAMLNMEVVRSRASHADADAGITSFAEAALRELERISSRSDALLWLLRPAREPADVTATLSRFAALLGGVTKGEWSLAHQHVVRGGGFTSARATDVRVALGGALVAAIRRDVPFACRSQTAERTTVYIDCDGGGPLALSDDMAGIVRIGGIDALASAHGIVLGFPPTDATG
jgi:signal transduction histidine kinase